jgi:HK97 gp10 family phage protein
MSVTYKSNLHKIRAGMPGAIDTGLGRSANHIGDLAQQLAPEETGALKKSKVVERVKQSHWRVSFGRGLPDARAVFQEYGTRKMAAQPYLTPAARAIDPKIEVAKSVDELIKRNGV